MGRITTSVEQRRDFYTRHQAGASYATIAEQAGVSRECVRYWCRRQRAGGTVQTHWPPRAPTPCGHFHPRVRYVILRLRLAHPRWGPSRIRLHLSQRPSLHYLPLPSRASIGRYLHHWPRFRRPPRRTPGALSRPNPPSHVHECWQIDFKLGIPLTDGTLVNLHTVRDPVGAVCLGAYVFPAGQVGQVPTRVTAEEVRSVLRRCFARWGTLPDAVQTVGESSLIGQFQDELPSPFRLWLIGLGIAHRQIRPARPTDNAEVERCHRTVTDYAIVGNEDHSLAALQRLLDQAVEELASQLPSRASGCGGQPPLRAHPQIGQPRRPFAPAYEHAHFDLARVDAYLASLCLKRKVDKQGRVTLGGRHERYRVGAAYAHQTLSVRFDPTDRHFVFYADDALQVEVARQAARHLDLTDLTGIVAWPVGLGLQQLPLPLPKG